VRAAPTGLSFAPGTGEFAQAEGVDKAEAGGLYTTPTARRRLGVRARLRSSSLILVNRPPIAVGCWSFDGSPVFRGRGPPWSPGCLTGESEERETWTAESLRAASSIEGTRPDETSAVLRFRSTP